MGGCNECMGDGVVSRRLSGSFCWCHRSERLHSVGLTGQGLGFMEWASNISGVGCKDSQNCKKKIAETVVVLGYHEN